ncbi:MAG: alpha-L-fucosidase [Kiritimatiellae bacterium]|nr:alpha-L-fucosidase [Kiritimatiellia bacterium]MDD5519299.1 alpha-L-fucosidase [Kiritimatiellia bacterium]
MNLTRRDFIGTTAGAVGTVAYCLGAASVAGSRAAEQDSRRGSQRLSLERLKQFEALGYGMFISFDVEAFCGVPLLSKNNKDKGGPPAKAYAPDKLDVGQWISVARDAGMKYAVLTAKRYSGFCLWPSKHTDYTVANSGNKTDVVEEFVKACTERGVQPGLYYDSLDLHHCFGRRQEDVWRHTTSLYQAFMTNQITELLTNYGSIAEVWIDIPSVLGRGYRTFLYEHIARLQPNAVVLMNGGFHDGTKIPVDRIWPTDLISLERTLPSQKTYSQWKIVEGKEYYIPGEFCDSIMPSWYWRQDEKPRDDQKVLAQFQACREAGVNFLLDAPPDNHGLIPETTVKALMRLRHSTGI